MKFTTASLALCLALTSTAQETSLNVAQIISAYVVGTTLTIPAAESTSLASAIISVAQTFYDSPAATSLNSAILSAAPSASSASFAASGIPYGLVYTQSWYTKSVPTALQSVMLAQFSALNSVQEKILGTPTSTSASKSTNAAAMRTAAPVMLGAMGILGGAMVAM
ncbi:hypothetical protein BDZ45DRAFT_688720 [Acephala macrosclerotiorum]|nr:hypothetical protein BDZ45DRAFT_688720 [Acephala macrosclerotiorum]